MTLLWEVKKIKTDDKEELIQSKTDWSVTKGTIEKLRNVEFVKFNLTTIIEDIRPIFSIKANK